MVKRKLKRYDKPRLLHPIDRHLWKPEVLRLYLCFCDGQVGPLSRSALDGRLALDRVNAPKDLCRAEKRIIRATEKRTGKPYERNTATGSAGWKKSLTGLHEVDPRDGKVIRRPKTAREEVAEILRETGKSGQEIADAIASSSPSYVDG